MGRWMRIASRDRRASVRPCPLCRGGYGLCASDGRMQLGPRIDEAKRCPRLETYRIFLHHDKQGGFLATKREKAPAKIHSAQVIRTELDLLATAAEDLARTLSRLSASLPARSGPRRKPPKAQSFRRWRPIPAWARASSRAGEGDPLFAAGAALALLDAHVRRNPPAAGALRAPAWRS
jgi:hypothetical protein